MAAPSAVIYIRVSTEDQVASGLGLEAQERACREFAQAQGLEVSRTFVESGVSRWVLPAERPAMTELLGSLKRGQAVIALKVDRVGDAGPLALFSYFLRKKSVRLLLAECDNSGSLDSILQQELTAVLASHECRLVSARTKASMAEKRRRGERVTGRVYGWQATESGKLVEVPEELATIDRIKTLARDGEGWSSIARRLQSDRIPAPNGGTSWHPTVVRRIALRQNAA
jgi:DNA invertase Pin-like site-specific DNA recombinase